MEDTGTSILATLCSYAVCTAHSYSLPFKHHHHLPLSRLKAPSILAMPTTPPFPPPMSIDSLLRPLSRSPGQTPGLSNETQGNAPSPHPEDPHLRFSHPKNSHPGQDEHTGQTMLCDLVALKDYASHVDSLTEGVTVFMQDSLLDFSTTSTLVIVQPPKDQISGRGKRAVPSHWKAQRTHLANIVRTVNRMTHQRRRAFFPNLENIILKPHEILVSEQGKNVCVRNETTCGLGEMEEIYAFATRLARLEEVPITLDVRGGSANTESKECDASYIIEGDLTILGDTCDEISDHLPANISQSQAGPSVSSGSGFLLGCRSP